MAPQWTPQMAENLRWLMERRGMSVEDLRYRLGYAGKKEAEHLMLTTEPYRPRKLEMLSRAMGLLDDHPAPGWGGDIESFRRCVVASDALRDQASRPEPSRRSWWRRLADRLGFRESQERRKGCALAQQPETRGSSPRSCDSPNAKGE